MKNILKFATFILITFSSYAQDTIIFKENAKVVLAKVEEITDTAVRYKSFDNLEGPTYNIPISSVASIQYKNGKQEVFETTSTATASTEPVSLNKSKTNTFETVSGYPKVPFTNIPYFLEGDKITALEKSESESKKQRAGAWGKIYMRSIPGAASNIRFSRKSALKFLIQLEDSKANPFTVCQLVPCEVNAQREFIEAKQGMGGYEKQNPIKLEFQKLNDSGLYLIHLQEKVSKGEYFFAVQDTNVVYAFGLDK